MIYICMPVGDYYGWGVCGKNIIRELSKLTDVTYVPGPFADNPTTDPIAEYETIGLQNNSLTKIDGPVLQTMRPDFKPSCIDLVGTYNVGYTFFEKENLKQEEVDCLKRWDLVVAGSQWCADILEKHGVKSIAIPQGIDPRLFHYREKRNLLDKFVIFSGGRHVHRKGHDIVMKAVSAMQNKYDNVVLVTSWYDLWGKQDFMSQVVAELSQAGLDLSRVINLPPMPQVAMPFIYRDTDVGVFPNRIEGGTNLVLMEYMASGKPSVVSYRTGHMDVVTEENALLVLPSQGVAAVIDALDWAYNHYVKAGFYGESAAYSMHKRFTWEHTAERFLECLTEKQ